MASAAEVGMPDGLPINHINHKGGYPGFVQVAHSGHLSWGDYAGNNVFSTLGEHPCTTKLLTTPIICANSCGVSSISMVLTLSSFHAVLPDCSTKTALLHVRQDMLLNTKCLDSPAKLCTVTSVSFLPAGNLILDPEAALLFIDFTTGDTLHLSGRAEVHWDQVDLPGAQRTIIFQTEEWVHVKGALPIKQQGTVESSPYNPTPPSKPGQLQVRTCRDFLLSSLTDNTDHNSLLKLDA